MYPDLSLKEKTPHGTKSRPIHALHFTTGKGTPYPDFFHVEKHWHNNIEILFITKGSYLFEINLDTYILEEGDICILNCGDLHEITGQSADTIHDALLFDPQILDFSYEDEWEENYIAPFINQSLIFKNILHPADAGYKELEKKVRQLMSEALHQKDGWYIRCKLLLLEFFDLTSKHHLLLPAKEVLSAADAHKISYYKTIISYMEKHYSDSISLQQLADTIPCNSQYLCRIFKEVAGTSPIQCLISYRLERACSLLLHTAQPVMDIALDCGFDNISYFIRKFKTVKGCTPTEYRKRCTP